MGHVPTCFHSLILFFPNGFCLNPSAKVLSGDKIFGIPSPLSPLKICSILYSFGSIPLINFFSVGEYCFTLSYDCNCIKSLSPDNINIFSNSFGVLETISTNVAIISSASAPSTCNTL